MGKLGCLLKVQLLGLFGINRILHGEDRRGRNRLVLFGLAAAVLAAVVALYAAGTAQSLVLVGAGRAIPVLAVALGGLAGVAVTFLKANGQLFGFADFDLVMSMPVPTWQVVVSRIASLYGMNLLFALLLMGPMLGVYLADASAGPLSWLLAVGCVLLAPALPMAGAVILAYGLAALASRMRHANVVLGVLVLTCVVVLVVGLSAWSGGTGGDSQLALEEVGHLGDALAGMVASFYPPAVLAAAGVTEGDLGRFGLFALVSVAPLAIVVAAMAHWYLPVNAALASGRAGGARVGERAFAPRPAFFALVAKELRLLVSTPIYLTNTAVGPLLALVLGAACVVVGPEALFSAVGADVPAEVLAQLKAAVAGLVPWALGLCVALMSTSCASVSLEGADRWIMQTVPVPFGRIVRAKAAAYLVLAAPAALAGGVLAALGCRLGGLEAVACVAVPLATGAFAACCGVLFDARAPRYDWTTPYEVVKRGLSPVLTMLCGTLLAVGGGAACLLVPGLPGLGWLSAAAVSLACAAAVAVLAAVLLRAASRADLRDA